MSTIVDLRDVVKNFLCTGCGVCAGACFQNAINMGINEYGIYQPFIEENKCNNCGICLSVCPGHSFDYHVQYEHIYQTTPENIALGAYRAVFSGHSTDEEILDKSQSGGFVSTLLCHLIEDDVIDGAVVTRWKSDSPFEPCTYIARTRKEILEAVGSKYNSVPAATALEKIVKKPGRYAFVGTSCQIQGMRKAEFVFKVLRERIRLYIGLHCLGVFTYHFHDQILHKIRLKKENVKYFRHRDKAWLGWTCDMRIIDEAGREYNIDRYESRLRPREFFTPWRCRLCFDKANEFSDVSCGDCRIPAETQYFESKGYDLKKGVSEFVVRTSRGEDAVNSMIKKNMFIVHETNASDVARSIGVGLKKTGLQIYMRVNSYSGLKTPYYGVHFLNREQFSIRRNIPAKSAIIALEEFRRKKVRPMTGLVIAFIFHFIFRASRYLITRRLLMCLPHKVLGFLDKQSRRWNAEINSVQLEAKRIK